MKEQFKMNIKQLSKAWKTAYEVKDEITQGFEPEDGRYAVAIVSASIGESKASGRPQITWEYLFLDGEYKGKTFRSYDGLDRSEGLPYIMKRIESIGYDAPEEFEELENVLKSITKVKPKVKIVIKTKNDFKNTYVMERLDDEDYDEVMTPSVTERNGNGNKNEIEQKRVTKETQQQTGDELEIEQGSEVMCKDEDGEELGVGSIISIDEESQEVVVKINGKKHVVSFSCLSAVPKEEVTQEKKSKVKVR